ncbi:MAG: adenosylcobinamide-GDP ribazoletransferase [Lachnospiraceae bacterium]|nr:adenosylcobinamide-GDP ribazoletransferase [Lachnospiraceae bacterium]
MKGLLRSFVMAFSKYSISPKSAYERNKENCSYIMLFLPLIGIIICAIINRWAVLYPYACDFPVLPAVVCSVVPIILSAGVHLEGFVRTTDAISSHKSKEDKLHIIGVDAHGGYSSMIVAICIFLISIGIWSEMPIDGIFVVAFGYVISRALFAISVLTVKHASTANGKIDCYVPDSKISLWIQVLINIGYILVSAYLMIKIAGTFSTPRPSVAIACLIGAAITYIFYIAVSLRHFGGITEETGGFFVVLCELVIPIAALTIFKSPI